MKSEIESKPNVGRPTDYTQEIAEEICERLAVGESVRQITLLEHMPEERTVYRWLIKHEEFCQQYARAKEIQADRFNEELIDIADDGRNDWEERENKRGDGTYIALNDEAISRSKLRVETRKWLMGKHKPKKYGDSLSLKGDDKNPFTHKIEGSIDLTPSEAYLAMLNGKK